MSTAAVTPTNDGFVEIKPPELVKFDRDHLGLQLEGRFKSLATVDVKDKETGAIKKTPQYIIGTDKGDVKFFGTFDLSQKLTREHIGKIVRVTYVGDDPNVSKNGNPMKVFSVFVKANSAPSSDSLEITDADIPF